MKFESINIVGAVVVVSILSFAAKASAAPVNLSGNLTNSCVLSISTSGTLVAATDGKTITSDQVGGAPATFTLVALGAAPRVRFSAPTVETPAGFSGTATPSIKYSSARGADQAWTSASTLTSAGALLDSFTVHGRVEAPGGFAGGHYNVQTLVTCEQ